MRWLILALQKKADFPPSERLRHRDARVRFKRGLLPPKAADCASAPPLKGQTDVEIVIKS